MSGGLGSQVRDGVSELSSVVLSAVGEGLGTYARALQDRADNDVNRWRNEVAGYLLLRAGEAVSSGI